MFEITALSYILLFAFLFGNAGHSLFKNDLAFFEKKRSFKLTWAYRLAKITVSALFLIGLIHIINKGDVTWDIERMAYILIAATGPTIFFEHLLDDYRAKYTDLPTFIQQFFGGILLIGAFVFSSILLGIYAIYLGFKLIKLISRIRFNASLMPE